MSVRAEVVRLARFLLAAVDALIDQACECLERQADELNAETARRKAEREMYRKIREANQPAAEGRET